MVLPLSSGLPGWVFLSVLVKSGLGAVKSNIIKVVKKKKKKNWKPKHVHLNSLKKVAVHATVTSTTTAVLEGKVSTWIFSLYLNFMSWLLAHNWITKNATKPLKKKKSHILRLAETFCQNWSSTGSVKIIIIYNSGYWFKDSLTYTFRWWRWLLWLLTEKSTRMNDIKEV